MKFRYLFLALLFISSQAHAAFWIPDGSITNAKLAPKSIISGINTGVYSATSSWTTMTNMSIVIPGDGRPYAINLSSVYNQPTTCEYAVSGASGTGSTLAVRIFDSTNNIYIRSYFWGAAASSSVAGSLDLNGFIPGSNVARTVVAQVQLTFPGIASLNRCGLYAIAL